MEALERFSDWMQSDGLAMAHMWYAAVLGEALQTPLPFVAIAVMPFVVGLLARSVATLIGAAVFSAVTLTAATTNFPDEIQTGLATATLVAFALLCFHAAAEHRRHILLRRAISGLQAQNADTRALLDREIKWRMAGEPMPPTDTSDPPRLISSVP